MGVTDKQIRKALESNGGNKTQAAKLLGMCRGTLRSRLSNMHVEKLIPRSKDKDNPQYKEDITDNQRIIESKGRFDTVDEALDYAKIDRAIWEVERTVINGWDVTMKAGRGSPKTIQNKQIKIWLRRKVPKMVAEAAEMLIERMKKHSPKPPKYKPFRKIKDPHMLEVSVFDSHFGKLAWAQETGQNYDLKIAEKIFVEVIEDLLSQTQHRPIEKILFVLGQDFLHIDNSKNMTVNDTVQDVDGRISKIFMVAGMACVRMLGRMAEVAPVEVLYVPGNHDRTTSWFLTAFLSAWFRLNDRVTIDLSPKLRKYMQYGPTLLGFTHGDEEKQANLPLLMAEEVKELWAATTHHEWHTGHYHKPKEMRFNTTESFVNTIVRTLPSISGTDYWHYKKGFINNTRAAEAYLWSKRTGYAGHYPSNVVES